MKRIFSMFLAFVLVIGCVLALSACGDEETESKAESKTESETESETASSAAESTGDESSVEESVEDTSSVSDETSSGEYTGESLVYEGGKVTFAYPAEWTLYDDETQPSAMNDSGDEAITLASVELAGEDGAIYTNIDQAFYENYVKEAYEILGFTASDATIESKTNAKGTEVIVMTYSLSYDDEGTVSETDVVQIFCFDETYCHMITYSAYSTDFSAVLIDSIALN